MAERSLITGGRVSGRVPERVSTVSAMAKLIYSPIASLDGYVADDDGKWGWSVPDNAVHALVNDLARPVGTWLLGRRMYDVLVAWETIDDEQAEIRDFADIWRAADKVVYSRTLEEPSSARNADRARVRA